MSYDPCGTQHLEGDEIIKRLAKYLNIDPRDLTDALIRQSEISKAIRTMEETEKPNGN